MAVSSPAPTRALGRPARERSASLVPADDYPRIPSADISCRPWRVAEGEPYPSHEVCEAIELIGDDRWCLVATRQSHRTAAAGNRGA